MEKRVKNLILQGDFIKAKGFLNELSSSQLRVLLLHMGYDEENICAYSFVCFLLLEKESVDYHCLASEVLCHAFPYLEGGYATALYHMRRSVALAPDDIELKESLLFFNTIPEKLVSDEEARIVAAEIFQRKPTSVSAQRVLAENKDN